MDSSRENYSWLWYFLTLALLTIVATTILATYNYRQQLRPETVAAAIDLWNEWSKDGPNYVLTYSAKKNDDSGETADHYVVKVKDGKPYEALCNGVPLDDRQLPEYGMDKLLKNIADFMKCDAEPGKPKVYLRGDFDAKTGAVLRYVRRVMGTRQRLEIVVESLEYQSKKGADSSNQ